MPELPEVETVCTAIRPYVVGRQVRTVSTYTRALRHPLNEIRLQQHIEGQTVRALRRRGKFLVFELSNQRAVVCHLGMTGAFKVCDTATPRLPHEHVVWQLDNHSTLRFEDARRFGMMLPATLSAPGTDPDMLNKLGPEPLGTEFTPAYVSRSMETSIAPVKNLLLNQTLVAGIGNIYANEALFMARVSPRRKGKNLGNRRCIRIVRSIRTVLTDAITCGGTTIRDFRTPDGAEGHFRTCLNVYGKNGQPCPECGNCIRRIVQAGRSTFYCPTCQR
ncbi:MAG: bifunctional DNA-formamidopyrimidine glycosylase/DNA-(apurinic or apyrimidinic site) lyase [Candidatus Pacebacteria bacterium]|nr:bifunctional DNA-formamidopyrimidine glycosylase/DNA-(apurinic or apyrimidinic site) lyase [Candidatus Paceibacterota bacterium]